MVNGTRTRRSQTERTEESGRRMLDAGIQLILAHGPLKTTLKDVGEKAGYSRGLASYRFGSKEGLFQEILASGRKLWLEELETFVAQKTGLAAIVAALDAMQHFLDRASDHYRAMLVLWYESIGQQSPLRARLAEQHKAQRRDIQRWLQQGIEAGEIDPSIDHELFAAGFFSFIFGTVYQWQVNPDAFKLPDLIEAQKGWITQLLTAKLQPA